MKPVKLMALDAEDLTVVSSLVQDAVTRPDAMRFDADTKRFSIVLNRFAWDAPGRGSRRAPHERRQSVLSFAQVEAVRSTGIRRGDAKQVLSMLALNHDAGEAGGGVVTVMFSDGPMLQLDVACIEVQLADMGAAWATRFKPRHPLS